MRVLITSSRMPFALDAIRKLGERGHEVFACDSYAASPGSHSKYLAGHFTTASPSGDPEQFAADVERIAAARTRSSVVVPMFEEVFYLAAQHERISAVTRLYAPPFRTLAQVHDKGTFQELCDRLEIRTPRTVLAHTRRGAGGGDRAISRATSRGPRSRAAGSACSPTPGRWRGTSRPTTATRPRRTPGWCRSSSAGRCTAPTPPCTTGRSPPTCPIARPGSGSTRPGSSSSRSTRSDTLPTVERLGLGSGLGRPDVARLHRDRARAGDDRVQPAPDRRRAADGAPRSSSGGCFRPQRRR